MIDFTGKNILIVGASAGIGAETACVLAENGANVILVARREDRLKEVCEKISSDRKAHYVGDVSDINSIAELIKKIVDENGKLDGMAYVAGISTGGLPLNLLTFEKQMSIFKTNYFGFVECVRQVTKRGFYNAGMRIAAVSSVASLCGERALIAYSASKSAMDSAIRCMAKELSGKGICINSVAPSMVKTDMYQGFLETQADEKSDANIRALNRQYLGLAEARDVANAIAFLLSDKARFITGITLPVDGGFSTT